MEKRSFKHFVERKLGKIPQFLIYAVLEWIMIFILFLDGFLAYFAIEFAKLFDLPSPCLLCTCRIERALLRKTADSYYNDSICNNHKKSVSYFAFCHTHKKLSDLRSMCESCLLSFATEKESDCDTYKSLLGILHKDIQLFVDGDHEVHLSLPSGKQDEEIVVDKSNDLVCSCCRAPLKVKPSRCNSPRSFLPRTPSPKAPTNRNLDFSHVHYMDFKFNSDESMAAHDDNDRLTKRLTVLEDGNGDDEDDKTPTFVKENKYFGISLEDSTSRSAYRTKIPRKMLPEKAEFALELGDGQVPTEAEGDILLHLKGQVRLDRKSLMALYMELDEERNASAVAAYNAMAMITRLQGEKAAVQMEALQYQRMMDEQAEYDQEILQEMNNLLAKREEEIKELEDELDVYRENYGSLKAVDFDGEGGVEGDDEGNRLVSKPPSYSCNSPSSRRHNEGRLECISPTTRWLNGWRGECTSPTSRRLNEWRGECRRLNEGLDWDARASDKAQIHDSLPNSVPGDGGGEDIDKANTVPKGCRQLSRLKI